MRTYRHLFRVVRPSPFGYYWETTPVPDWVHFTIEEIGDSKVLTVHSRIHVNKAVKVGPSYSKEYSDTEILKDMSGEIYRRFIN